MALEKEKERLRKLELAAAAAATTTSPINTIKVNVENSESHIQSTSMPKQLPNGVTKPSPTQQPSTFIDRFTVATVAVTSERPHTKTRIQKQREKKFRKQQYQLLNLTNISDTMTSTTPPTTKETSTSATIRPITTKAFATNSYEKTQRVRRFLDSIFEHQRNFKQKFGAELLYDAQTLPLSHSLIYSTTTDSNYPPARSTSNLRRICRNECELLENELCQKEYAIAKRHPAIGQILPIEDCSSLPIETNDCSSLGIAIDVDENEDCYWENGSKYRGTTAVSQSGKPCLTWARLMKEIADYPELAGTNYCR